MTPATASPVLFTREVRTQAPLQIWLNHSSLHNTIIKAYISLFQNLSSELNESTDPYDAIYKKFTNLDSYNRMY